MALPRASRDAVLRAIAEFDDLGRDEFLEKHGFGRAKHWLLVHDGKEYDSKAIYGVAVGIENPGRGRSTDFSGGEQSVVRRLRDLGFEVRNSSGDGQSPDQAQTRSDRSPAWIFQSNPRFYDIGAAVEALREMNWTVAQGKNLVHTGDHVYIWQSGEGGGVIAEGTILTDPQMLPNQEGEQFIVDKEKFDGEQLRVRLSIDRVLREPLERTRLLRHPILKDLGILRFANATNYNISEEQDEALQVLSNGEAEPPSPLATARVWWVNQGTHYREERDGELIWAPLTAKDGRPRNHWSRMREADVGDLVLHYANGSIRALGEVTAEATEAPRPVGLSEEAWTREGLLMQIRYTELAEPVALEQIPEGWRIEEGAPFTRQGSVQQGYFYPLTEEFVKRMATRFPQLGIGALEESAGDDYEEPEFLAIVDSVQAAGLSISNDMLRRYHLSLKTRGFVILSGVSGTGKTWLAEVYARAVGAEYWLESVAPNWTTNEDLLGYLDPLSNEFRFTAFSQFIRDAAAEYETASRQARSPRPFHVTLDEMNLARVEYYFARFLSAMELRSRNDTAELRLAPDVDLLLTPNLFFSGTVNIDETTKGFSDKVYDRAQLLELTVERDLLEQHLGGKPYADFIMEVWDNIHLVAPFAFRTLDEIAAYHHVAEPLGVSWEQAIDEQLLQKVLPKFRGGELPVQEALEWLVTRTGDDFPRTNSKASAMLTYCREHGFTDYFV